ncbi:hypothetical protein [Algiphilus sp.]|uniref:hypothetical protein n=1 Tax=Algiphilus sp. TaxID=1872431 RepID=UPI0025BC1544|nr:hypothetical protein [Algiphilus sp.]MCK5769486.1 hypothetical protein [Algiphilus sp.]
MSGVGLLTARQLMVELGRLGVGSWKPDAARQWIREEPACPSEAPMAQGQPRLYRIADVLAWLRVRAVRERAKGWSSGGGPDLVARIDAATAHLADPSQPLPASGADEPRDQACAGASGQAVGAGAAPAAASDVAPVPAALPASAAGAEPVSPAKEHVAWSQLSDAEALLQVLEGRDPRNWLAAENALKARQQRLEEARRLVPVEDVGTALNATITMVRGALLSLVSQLDVELEGCATRAERRQVVRDRVHAILERMAKAGIDAEEPADA